MIIFQVISFVKFSFITHLHPLTTSCGDDDAEVVQMHCVISNTDRALHMDQV